MGLPVAVTLSATELALYDTDTAWDSLDPAAGGTTPSLKKSP